MAGVAAAHIPVTGGLSGEEACQSVREKQGPFFSAATRPYVTKPGMLGTQREVIGERGSLTEGSLHG